MSANTNGKWIHAEKRLALYLRDGCACVWCGQTLEEGCTLTLDHVIPREHGGTHEASNLVTACLSCNSRRGSRSASAFARAVAEYVNHGVTAEAILRDIKNRTRRSLTRYRTEAKKLIERRGTAAKALAALVTEEAA